MPFADGQTRSASEALPMEATDYLNLVNATGMVIVDGKRGRIDAKFESIVMRLGLTADQWLRCSTAFREHHYNGDMRLTQSA